MVALPRSPNRPSSFPDRASLSIDLTQSDPPHSVPSHVTDIYVTFPHSTVELQLTANYLRILSQRQAAFRLLLDSVQSAAYSERHSLFSMTPQSFSSSASFATFDSSSSSSASFLVSPGSLYAPQSPFSTISSSSFGGFATASVPPSPMPFLSPIPDDESTVRELLALQVTRVPPEVIAARNSADIAYKSRQVRPFLSPFALILLSADVTGCCSIN